MVDSSLRGRWLNRPWHTDWVVWVAAGVGVAGMAGAVAQQGGTAVADRVVAGVFDVLVAVPLAVACGAGLALARAVLRVLLRVRPGRERVLTLTVRLKELGGSVTYTRHPDGVVTAGVRGIPLRRRLEALAAAHAHAERHGLLEPTSVDEDANRPGGQ
ncbi:hypothetical protein [Cellulomonas alba]|uniref:PH domain-containing protein n=1 Tax=Cellulomonas alba TaxID=3053467 RepID=A0ABT7SEC0_9CELL|nr:hypothetical protein [Cellulomonas alba]MDM7854543.1 hypothetical protein [Cellulomonas alba]